MYMYPIAEDFTNKNFKIFRKEKTFILISIQTHDFYKDIMQNSFLEILIM